MRAVAQAADGATLLKQRTLALWVAQNQLAAAQVGSAWPAPGTRAGDAMQSGTRFVWHESVSGTPNPSFRKVEITVSDPDTPDYALARIAGYLGQPPRR